MTTGGEANPRFRQSTNMDNVNLIIIKQKIEFAIVQNRLLSFDYVAKDLSISRDRLVKPTGFTEDKFFGEDTTKGKRQFDLKGIQELKILGGDI